MGNMGKRNLMKDITVLSDILFDIKKRGMTLEETSKKYKIHGSWTTPKGEFISYIEDELLFKISQFIKEEYKEKYDRNE